MKNPISRDTFSSSASEADKEITEAVVNAIESNNKIVEIRPAKQPGILRRVAPLLLVGSAVGALLWWRKSEEPSGKIQDVATRTAERTREVTEQAAETVEEGGETVSREVEKGGETVSEEVARESRKAGDHVEKMGEDVAESTEEAGEEMSKRADGSGKKAGDSSSSKN